MRAKDIEVGKTYVNKGKGRTKRKVLAIGVKYRPTSWFSNEGPPDEPGVLYVQEGTERNLYLSSFASWAGREAE